MIKLIIEIATDEYDEFEMIDFGNWHIIPYLEESFPEIKKDMTIKARVKDDDDNWLPNLDSR